MKRKVLYISGTRADYGLMHEVLTKIHSHPQLSLDIAITGMHLLEDFGNTQNEILNDGFSCFSVEATIYNDSQASMVSFIGNFIQKLGKKIEEIRPNFILVLGDRAEMLAGAICGAYMCIPVVHLHGGEISSTVDDLARNAITKLAHVHLPATEESAARIIRMGENPANVFVVGAPGLDQIHSKKLPPRNEILSKYNLDPDEPFFLVVQHPVTLEIQEAQNQIRETLEALVELGIQTLLVYPNADAGGRAMINVIKEYDRYSHIQSFKNIPHTDFLSLLQYSTVLIGNSSSGIIEAPSFGTPVVNIGTRQQGRQRGDNVIDSGYNRNDIINAIKRAITDKNFLSRAHNGSNPYGNGHCGDKVVNVLITLTIDDILLQKRMMY